MEIQSDIKNLLAGAVAAAGFQLWGAEIIQSGRTGILRVYIDSAKGVNIDDCEAASKQIRAVLEVEAPTLRELTLEVSSPGIFRPLYTLEQFQLYINMPIKVKLKYPNENNRKNFSGVLQQADTSGISILIDGENFTLDIEDIAQAHLNPDI